MNVNDKSMKLTCEVLLNNTMGKLNTCLSTGQFAYIEKKDPYYLKLLNNLNKLKPVFFRSHNNYNNEYCEFSGVDDFQIVEPYPPGHPQYKWDFGKLDEKIDFELQCCDPDTFVYNIRTCPMWMLDRKVHSARFPYSSGIPRDKTYKQLAEFCARIVGWYNKGGFVDETGKYYHSGHFYNIKYWDILNEMDEGQSAIYIGTGKEYAKAYDRIVKEMKKVDEEIFCGGPSLSTAPTERDDITYLKEFIEYANEDIDFLSIHYYGDMSGLIKHDHDDIAMFGEQGKELNIKKSTSDTVDGKYLESIDDIADYIESIVKLTKKHGDIPIMISEANVTLDYAFDSPRKRGEFSQGIFGIVWFSYLYKTMSIIGVRTIQQYQYYSPSWKNKYVGNNLSLINNSTGDPNPLYWFIKEINSFFKRGGIIINNTLKGDVEILSVKYPYQKEISLLIINKAVPKNQEKRFYGKNVSVDIFFGGEYRILKNSLKCVVFDSGNCCDSSKQIEICCKDDLDGKEDCINASIKGYGVALIKISYI